MSGEVRPFELAVDQSELDYLHRRLDDARWPDAETVDGWEQGVPIDRLRPLIDHWRNRYDWRRCEAFLNGCGQFKTEIDGLDIHFLHIRSPHADAMPLLLTHGWPGSVIEFAKVIGPLSDPVAHGGNAADAFHLVIPSLPGYSFSDKPAKNGWTVQRTAHAWAVLMRRLGYDRYVAQGGDWGSRVTVHLANHAPEGLAGVHFNFLSIMPTELGENPTELERTAAADYKRFLEKDSAYAMLQRTRPQTIGYSLADSPIGQAAWIYEKLQAWTDCDGEIESLLSYDEMLDNIMLYWLPNNGASSARLYWESSYPLQRMKIAVPMGYSAFPSEVVRPARKWAEDMFSNIIHWNTLDRGGHFAAFEQPELFAEEVRTCFRKLR